MKCSLWEWVGVIVGVDGGGCSEAMLPTQKDYTSSHFIVVKECKLCSLCFYFMRRVLGLPQQSLVSPGVSVYLFILFLSFFRLAVGLRQEDLILVWENAANKGFFPIVYTNPQIRVSVN